MHHIAMVEVIVLGDFEVTIAPGKLQVSGRSNFICGEAGWLGDGTTWNLLPLREMPDEC